MKRIIIALVLSALSLVGGHFFNRRWDRAILFFVTLSVLAIASWTMMMSGMMSTATSAKTQDISGVMARSWTAFGSGVLVLWLVSLGVTYYEAKRPDDTMQYRWSKSGVVAAFGLSLMCAVFLSIVSIAYSGTITRVGDDGIRISSSSSRHSDLYNFHNFIGFGREAGASDKLTKPPVGDGYLRGRFVYAGKPVEGITLKLALNGKYETELVTTDADGVFTVRVPAGEWRVDRVMTQGWRGKPDKSEFLIVTGREPRLGNGNYDSYFWLNDGPLKITVENTPTPPQMNFVIRDQMKLIWPSLDKKKVAGNASKDVISWEAYPEAQEYQIRITNLKREGNRTYLHEVTTKRLKGTTEFPLSSLESVENKEGEQEYQVAVWAFAKDGSFLSNSEKFSDSSVFVLKDKQLVRDEERKLISGPVNADNLETLHANTDRIEAIEALLKDDLVAEAERLLGKVQGTTDPGKKKSITGYLFAKQGKCQEANRMFAEALSEAGTNCVPEYYRAKCPKN